MPTTTTMLKIHTADEENSAAVKTFSWCVEPELVELLIERGIHQPRLLIATMRNTSETFMGDRYDHWTTVSVQVVPLQSMLAYVTFAGPGRHRIAATVVDTETYAQRRALRNCVRNPRTATINQAGSLTSNGKDSADITWSYVTSTVDLVVEGGHFAAELPAWRKWVAKKVYGSTKMRDECQARRRTYIFGPLLLPLVFLGTYFVKLLILPFAMSLLFLRGFPWKIYFQPLGTLGTFLDELVETEPSSYLFHDSDGRRRQPALPFFILNPLTLVLVPFLLYGASYGGPAKSEHHFLPLWSCFAIVDGGLVTIIALVFAGIFIVGKVTGRPPKPKTPVDEAALRRVVAGIVCGDQTMPSSFGDVSWSARTPRLIYQAAKAKVCKPFAQY